MFKEKAVTLTLVNYEMSADEKPPVKFTKRLRILPSSVVAVGEQRRVIGATLVEDVFVIMKDGPTFVVEGPLEEVCQILGK